MREWVAGCVSGWGVPTLIGEDGGESGIDHT